MLFARGSSSATGSIGETAKAAASSLLRQFLTATGEAEADSYRKSLIAEYAEPLIREIVSAKMRAAIGRSDRREGVREEAAENVYCDAIVALGRQMDRWRRGMAEAPTADKFCDYVAVVAYNACKQRAAPGAPRRGDAQANVYYLLTRQPGLALWKSGEAEWLGGFAQWRDEKRARAGQRRLQEIQTDPEACVLAGLRRRGKDSNLKRAAPVDLMVAILDEAGGPVEFDILVAVFTVLWDTDDQPVREVSGEGIDRDKEPGENIVEDTRDSAADIHAQQEQRDFLRKSWAHIRQIPPEQRAALLLNLQDADARLLPVMRIARFEEIASILNMTPDELAKIWNGLPLDDSEIAERLQVTVQQVKNLRQAAYRTLAWRMRSFDRGALRRLWESAVRLEPPRSAALMLYLRDAQGLSILALLPKESIVNRGEIAARLAISLADLNQAWPYLPLSFRRIGEILGKAPPQIVRFYLEARGYVLEQLSRMQEDG